MIRVVAILFLWGLGPLSAQAQGVEALTGNWAGKGVFQRQGSDRAMPLSCRYTAAAAGASVLNIQLRCATRQGANRAELTLSYDNTGRIVRAKIAGAPRGSDQDITLQQEGTGFVVRGGEGGTLSVRLLEEAIEVDVTDPARGSGSVRMLPVGD